LSREKSEYLVEKRRTAEGYLYCIPYVGDLWFLTPEPTEGSKIFGNNVYLEDLLTGLEGRKVRITIEILE
jgi:hypothetical protein